MVLGLGPRALYGDSRNPTWAFSRLSKSTYYTDKPYNRPYNSSYQVALLSQEIVQVNPQYLHPKHQIPRVLGSDVDLKQICPFMQEVYRDLAPGFF